MLTKVGVYALIRVFTLLFTHDTGLTHTVLLWVAIGTMVVGVIGAAAQAEIRRILSFHIVSQIGYMILGLALFTPLAIAGAVFYVVHHIIVKANLFLVGGVAARLSGSMELKRIGGLWRSAPVIAVLFLIPAGSLAGFPPLSGFWAKLAVLRAGLEAEAWIAVAAALAVGLLTLYSMTKIWGEAFWKPHPDGEAAAARPVSRGDMVRLAAPIAGLAAITLAIGVYAQPLFELALRASEELMDPAVYVAAVLGPEAAAQLSPLPDTPALAEVQP